MSMAVQRPSASSNRPAYMDRFYRDAPLPQSAHSSRSSISTTSSVSTCDPRNTTYSGRSLSPPPEEGSDASSVRSSKTSDKKWYKLGTILHRRTYPQSEVVDRPSIKTESETTSPLQDPISRRPSLPKVLTSLPPPQAINTYATRPLPALPPPGPVVRKAPSLMRKASAPLPMWTPPDRMSPKCLPSMEKLQHSVSSQELSCQKCYYFTARNCNGYVMGGEAGDACEGCLQSGFFGAK